MEDIINQEDSTRQHDLTIVEVKSFPMFAHFSDQEAREVISTIKKIAELAVKSYEKTKNIL